MEKALTAMVSSLTPTRLIVALISGGARYLLKNISEHVLCSLAFRQIFFFEYLFFVLRLMMDFC